MTDSSQDVLALGFYGAQDEFCGSLRRLPQIRARHCAVEAPCPEDVVALVVDAALFEQDDALFSFLMRCRLPALLISPPARAPALLERLLLQHDLCLEQSPAPLLLHRLVRLLETRRAARDTLTGLLDRQSFLTRLKEALLVTSERRPLSVLMVDVDRFKHLNDLYGHQSGDNVLQELARRLTGATEPGTTLARFGGNSFTFLLHQGEEGAQALAQRALEAVRARTFSIGAQVSVSVSGTTVTRPGRRLHLLRQVEQAMFAAKARGRDGFMHYASLERDALAEDTDLAARSFEDMTRVVSERIAETIAWRGRRMLEEIKQQADLDGLTGLYSRRYLDRRLGWELQQSQHQAHELTVALLDIDFFGQVNKEHGWPCGDRVLRQVAELIRSKVRSQDWVARYGGEEICLVMRQTSVEDAVLVLERIREAVASHQFFNDQGQPFAMTVSLGAASRGPRRQDNLEAFLGRVSQQLLTAKRGGRDRVCAELSASADPG